MDFETDRAFCQNCLTLSFGCSNKTASSWTCGTSVVRERSDPTGRTIMKTLTVSSTSSTLLMTSDWKSATRSSSHSSPRTTWRAFPSWSTLTSKIWTWHAKLQRSCQPSSWKTLRKVGPGTSRPAPPSPKKVWATAWSGSSRPLVTKNEEQWLM